MIEQVILVDDMDRAVGLVDKMEAHQKGLLHRAFSVFVFNTKGELLMQQRALDKYHSAGLWSNTCCSHPQPGESLPGAASRRLEEEMGLSCDLTPAFSFLYHAKLDSGLIEHEYDHVFFGKSDELPKINHTEVRDYKYIDLELLKEDIEKNHNNYTVWLHKCLDRVILNYKWSISNDLWP